MTEKTSYVLYFLQKENKRNFENSALPFKCFWIRIFVKGLWFFFTLLAILFSFSFITVTRQLASSQRKKEGGKSPILFQLHN